MVRISIPRYECGTGPIEGQTVSVHSTVQTAKGLTAYTYAWTVTGTRLAHGESGNGATLKIIAPSATEQVRLALSVSDDDGFVGTASATFTPITFAQAAVNGFICRVEHLVKVNMLVDPLWDPRRDLNLDPVTEPELERVLGIAEQIVRSAQSALVAFTRSRHELKPGTKVSLNGYLRCS